MKLRGEKISPFLISVTAVIAVTVLICVSALSCRADKIQFKASYYFVCYTMQDNSLSASSISSAVTEYGGAGYILEHGGKYYISISCYYEQNDADAVRLSLLGRNMDCLVLKIETCDYPLKTSNAKKNAELYKGNLNTLHTLSTLAYGCANSLDTGEYNQSKAKSVISDIKSGLAGLLNANGSNCFTDELNRLTAVCDDAAGGYIYSKDLRKLQIAIADTVINIHLT